MITFFSRKHIKYENGRDVIIAMISVASASELPAPDAIDGLHFHEGSGAWDISTGDEYGMLANGTWQKQPHGLPYGFLPERVG